MIEIGYKLSAEEFSARNELPQVAADLALDDFAKPLMVGVYLEDHWNRQQATGNRE